MGENRTIKKEMFTRQNIKLVNELLPNGTRKMFAEQIGLSYERAKALLLVRTKPKYESDINFLNLCFDFAKRLGWRAKY